MRVSFLVIVLLFPVLASAQETQSAPAVTNKIFTLGLGGGLDFGGFGINGTIYPEKHVGIFAGVGYALAGAGYNFGNKFRFNPDDKVIFTAGYMYGYNAALKISGLTANSKLYFGTSIFIGVDTYFGTERANYLSTGVILPFRDPAFQRDIDNFRATGGKINDPLPVAISIGYHFILQ